MRKVYVFFMVLTLVTFQSVLNCTQVYGNPSILKVVPPPIEIKAGQNFTVSIDICDVVDMFGYVFKLSWDTEFSSYVSHTHTSPWQQPIIIDPIIGENHIILSATAIGPPFFTGSTTLATVTLTALKSGETYISLSEVEFADGYGNPIPLVTEDAAIAILPPEHDIAVTGIYQKHVAGHGYPANIRVTVENQGDYAETFNVTLYANEIVIQTLTANLSSHVSTELIFSWNTTGFLLGGYSLGVYATPVTGETETEDNVYIDDVILVTIPGDVDGDFGVDIIDIVNICVFYGVLSDGPKDIDGNGKIDLIDIVIACIHYGQCPPYPPIPPVPPPIPP